MRLEKESVILIIPDTFGSLYEIRAIFLSCYQLYFIFHFLLLFFNFSSLLNLDCLENLGDIILYVLKLASSLLLRLALTGWLLVISQLGAFGLISPQ